MECTMTTELVSSNKEVFLLEDKWDGESTSFFWRIVVMVCLQGKYIGEFLFGVKTKDGHKCLKHFGFCHGHVDCLFLVTRIGCVGMKTLLQLLGGDAR